MLKELAASMSVVNNVCNDFFKKQNFNSYRKQKHSLVDIRNSFLSNITTVSSTPRLLNSWNSYQPWMNAEFCRALLSSTITNITTTQHNMGLKGRHCMSGVRTDVVCAAEAEQQALTWK